MLFVPAGAERNHSQDTLSQASRHLQAILLRQLLHFPGRAGSSVSSTMKSLLLLREVCRTLRGNKVMSLEGDYLSFLDMVVHSRQKHHFFVMTQEEENVGL